MEKSELPYSSALPGQTRPKPGLSALRKCITYPLILVCAAYLAYTHLFALKEWSLLCHANHPEPFEHPWAQVLDAPSVPSPAGKGDSKPSHEIFSVDFPLLDYGAPVFAQTLLAHHVFGNSWGVPAVTKYTPPPASVSFNRVVVNISTTVSGVQYDRLAHLYLNNVPLWRTSTAEPGNRDVVFNATKDLSEYHVLFSQEGELVYQLDNIVLGRLNGEFNVTITAFYYDYRPHKSPENSSLLSGSSLSGHIVSSLASMGKDKNIAQLKEVFSVLHHPPTTVSPLVDVAPPLKYLPDDELSYVLARFSPTTVAATLRLFVSGNAAEEFWYSNVLEDNVRKFDRHGHHLLGKGPVRKVKVYLNGYLIAVESPKPVIFTGGISPAFWNPVVGNNAFDLGHIDVDLTTYLPLLWSSENKLTVEVATGSQHSTVKFFNIKNKLVKGPVESKGSADGQDPGFVPGQNWIATGSILLWQNENVTDVGGVNPYATAPLKGDLNLNFGSFIPSKIFQVVTGGESVSNFGILQFSHKNYDTPASFAVNTTYALSFSNVQNYKNYGDKQSVMSTIDNTNSIQLLLNDTAAATGFTKLAANATLEKKYVTILNANITFVDPDADQGALLALIGLQGKGTEVLLDVALVQADSFKARFNNYAVFTANKVQNGTSVYYISPKGNHGTGALDTKLKAKHAGKTIYKRRVKAANGTVISDEMDDGKLDDASSDAAFSLNAVAGRVDSGAPHPCGGHSVHEEEEEEDHNEKIAASIKSFIAGLLRASKEEVHQLAEQFRNNNNEGFLSGLFN